MQDENSVSQSPVSNNIVNSDDFVNADDLGKLVGDTSFSDVTSDDSSGWMHKIDVTNFQRLTSNSSSDNAAVVQTELNPAPTSYLSMPKTESPTGDEIGRRINFQYGAYGASSNSNVVSTKEIAATSSRPYDSRQFNADAKLSPPLKKIRQRDPSHFEERRKSSDEQPQISIVSSTSDTTHRVVGSRVRPYPKPVYSYSCMIALALKNSQTGRLQVAEIYCFMCENFPYFRNAPAGWKNSVRHNLSLNKCFEKVEVEAPGGHGRKCCLWRLNPQKTTKMEQEVKKYREKDPYGVREAYAHPEDMELVEQGLKGLPNKTIIHHSSGYGRNVLPDVVQQIQVDVQQQSQPSPYTSVGSGASGLSDSGYIGVGKSELALKLLKQAANYSPSNWTKTLSLPQSAPGIQVMPASTWPPSHIENNRHSFTPTSPTGNQCPLEYSPIHHQSYQVFSPPPFSTPIRRSTMAACHSPYSRSQPVTDTQQHRPSSLHHFNSDIPVSTWCQSNSPNNPRPLPVFTMNHRTPERPGSCGYIWGGDGMFGGGNSSSLLVTPTTDNHQQRGFGFGGPLESAFCAATAHNNSLLLQGMQPLDEQRQSDGGVHHPLVFHSLADNPPDAGLHLTSL